MPRQTRKKKGGKQVNLSNMDTNKVDSLESDNEKNNDMNDDMNNEPSNKSLKGGMDNLLEEEFSNRNNASKEIKGGSDNINMEVNERPVELQNTNNASTMIDSMGSMFKNALTGLTGSNNNSVKIGGAGGGQATKLQNKLFTSLKSRSNKLNENLVELASLQNNLNAKTNMIKNEVHGLQEQFKLYNKMAGGRKSRKKRYKSKNHSRHRRKTKHRRRRRRKH
tara:strand:- start:828 stop:1493 length:666 start_codon:yes stop_codon:yes gene_type:complete